jgi:hypothetical protein
MEAPNLLKYWYLTNYKPSHPRRPSEMYLNDLKHKYIFGIKHYAVDS